MSHSTVRLRWSSTSVPNAARVRFGLTAAYEAGPGGGIQGVAPRSLSGEELTVNVPGLAPSANYQFCPQVSNDGGTTWSACVNFAVTTAARPATHPEYPEPPPAVDAAYPDTTGYTVRSVASNCSNLQAQLNAAAAAQVNQGSIIEIQPGTVCKGAYELPSAPDVKRFNTAGVRTSTATITLVNHGFSDGQKVKLSGGSLPGSAGPDPFRQFRGIKFGDPYYIKRVSNDAFQLSAEPGGPALDFTTSTFIADANANTFTVPSTKFKLLDGTLIQVKSTGALPSGLAADTDYYVKNPSNSTTFQLSTTWGGAAIDILTAGSGTHSFADRGSGGAILAWPPAQNWIIVRTAVPDEQFVPEGVRVSPEWQSKMAIIKPSGRWDTQFPIAIRTQELVHHWRFVGIEFTHDDTASAEIATTIDPHGYMGFLYFNRDAGHIVVDRCYLHGLGYPNRVARAISGYDGESMAIINSYWDKLDWWHPYRDGVQPSLTNASTLTISSGTYYTGPANRTLASPVSVYFTGSATGPGKVYFDMSGTLRVLLPTGMNATCSGFTCAVQNAANPEFPYNSDPHPRMAAAPIANLTFTNGQLTGVDSPMEPSTGMLEGSSSFLAGTGPGPFLIENNYISGTGIPIHFDDWGNGHYTPGRGYTIRRNHFTVPLSQIAGSPWADGKRYGHRVQMEWKNGTHILIDGNIFENSPAENTPVAVALLIMATGNGKITDVTISNNLIRNAAGGIAVSGPVNTGITANPLQRVHIYNNLFYRLNGFTYAVKPNMPNGALGVQLFMGGAMEDVRIEGNTVYDSRGTIPLFLLTGDPAEGMSLTNNVIWANGPLTSTDSYGYQNTPGCPQFGKAAFDCMFRAGVGQPSYEFSANTVIVGWSDQAGTVPADPGWMRSMYGSLDVDIYSMNEAVARLGWMVGERGSVAMGAAPETRAGSPKRASAAAAAEMGADLEALERAMGRIRAPSVQNVRASAAVISFQAPARGAGCYVLYGTGADVTSYSRTGVNRSASLERRIELKDLNPGFRHQYVVMCEGAQDQPRGVFETRVE